MQNTKVYVAGHRGLVGSALVRSLLARGHERRNLLTRTHAELDLTDQLAVNGFFEAEKPDLVFLAAAKVGGIAANNSYPADFIRANLAIQTNVIHAAYKYGVKRLMFLGSSCIYPRLAAQPLKEDSLLTGQLEPTNRPYAVAKIAGIEMCWSYNRQYRTQFLAIMPANLYGAGDNYDANNSHVIPGLLRRFHQARRDNAPVVTVWGTGTPRREFLFSDDLADACLHLAGLPDARFQPLLAQNRNDGFPPIVNVGVGKDITIAELSVLISETVGYRGRINYDPSKPDGTPQKLLDCSRLTGLGWVATTPLLQGLKIAYEDFQAHYSL